MCDKLNPSCCVANTTASKTACIANGGTPSSDPCNILNPTADANTCAASKVIPMLPQWAIITIAVLMLVFGTLGAILYLKFQTGSSLGGGRRGLNILASLKKMKW